MALNNTELTTHILAIEEKLNEMQIVINNLASRRQMKNILNVRQAEIDVLQTEVLSLKSQVALLQAIVAS